MFSCGCHYFAGVGFNFAMDADQRGVILMRAADPVEGTVNMHGRWSSQINLYKLLILRDDQVLLFWCYFSCNAPWPFPNK